MTSLDNTLKISGRQKAYLVSLLVLSVAGSIPIMLRLISDALILTSGTFVGVDINAYFFSLLLLMVFVGGTFVAINKLGYRDIRVFSYRIEFLPELIVCFWYLSFGGFLLLLFVPLYMDLIQ
jgi:hypothetical protein